MTLLNWLDYSRMRTRSIINCNHFFNCFVYVQYMYIHLIQPMYHIIHFDQFVYHNPNAKKQSSVKSTIIPPNGKSMKKIYICLQISCGNNVVNPWIVSFIANCSLATKIYFFNQMGVNSSPSLRFFIPLLKFFFLTEKLRYLCNFWSSCRIFNYTSYEIVSSVNILTGAW